MIASITSLFTSHWDWLVAAGIGHVGMRGLVSTVTWVKDQIALVKAFVRASEANVKAAAAPVTVAPPVAPVPPAK